MTVTFFIRRHWRISWACSLFRLVKPGLTRGACFEEMNRALFSPLIDRSWQYRDRTKGGERLENGTWGESETGLRDFRPALPAGTNIGVVIQGSASLRCNVGNIGMIIRREVATLARLITGCHRKNSRLSVMNAAQWWSARFPAFAIVSRYSIARIIASNYPQTV